MRTVFAAVAIAAGLAISAPAQAAYVIDAVESSPGVVTFTGSGSFDLIGLSFVGNGGGINGMWPAEGLVAVGAGLGHPIGDVYQGVIGPSAFGTASLFGPVQGNTVGPFIMLVSATGRLEVPTGYVSGTPLAVSQNTYTGTFASRGLTVGTYVWRLGQSPDADTFTLNIGGGVPEPSTWAMLILGAGMSGAAIRRRRTRLA